MKRLLSCLLLCLIFITACGPASPIPTLDTLYTDPGTGLGPISPNLYGSNLEPWTPVTADKMDLALDAHITAIRFPGGK